MKKDTCAPTAEETPFSCYSNKELQQLKTVYNNNKTYRRKVKGTSAKAIWMELATLLPCKQESCFATTLNVRTKAFAPKAPASWKKEAHEWLSSLEFLKLFKQYEEAFPDFKFFGPSAADYDFKMKNGKCEFDDMCTLDVRKLPPQIKKLGVVFNLDDHTKDGSHWVAMYVSISKKEVYYFDSSGEKIPSEIYRFYKQIKAQDGSYKFFQNYPVVHQRGESECGIYSIFFILSMMYREDFSVFTKQRWKDMTMNKLRKKMFRY